MRLRTLVAAAAVLVFNLAARADTFSYTLDAGASGLSSTGILTGDTYGRAGGYLVTGITGTNVAGLIVPTQADVRPGGHAADDILYPLGPGYNGDLAQLLDINGIAFVDQNSTGTYRVNVYSSGTAYYAFFTDANHASSTIPVQFSLAAAPATVTPEPSSIALLATGVLGAIAATRRRFV